MTVSEIFKRSDGSAAPIAELCADQHSIDKGHRILTLTDGWVMIAADSDDQLSSLRSVELRTHY